MNNDQSLKSHTEPRWRFDVVVLNYKRAKAFTENSNRILNLTPDDRLSFVTASPSSDEELIVRNWAARNGVTYRYLPRRNRGLAELARCEYFTGQCGGAGNLTGSRFIFHMQEHYLDTTSPWSKWDARFDYRIKGDVVPDNVCFDLNAIHDRMNKEGCVAAFADRNNPCWFEQNAVPHIAPSGGNFVLRTNELSRSGVQREILRLQNVCDNSYRWAVYAEFLWGTLFFREGAPVYDIKRDQVFIRFPREQFYIAPDDVARLSAHFESSRIARILDVRHALSCSLRRVRQMIGLRH
jgi:hypothetical protein